MPEAYLAMKRKFRKQGMDDSDAKTKAAKIYNSSHPDDPVTRDYDEKHDKGKHRKKRPVKYPTPK